MTKTNKTIHTTLNPTRNADEPEIFYTLENAGQQLAKYGDLVCIDLRIFLPMLENDRLDPNVEFGERVLFCGESLCSDWGTKNLDGPHRYREETFMATTYTEARALAAAYMNREYEKLDAALAKRQLALKNAGY